LAISVVMAIDLANLPDDVATLKRTAAAQSI
jgi:hypothetical protein